MYIYELPFAVNKELCRFMDIDDTWKDLAGLMKYSAFDVSEIEQTAQRHATSPTSLLFVRWGQLNHRAEELFMLLYHMKHIPAMRCMVHLIDGKFRRLLNKHDSCNVGQRDTVPVEDNLNKRLKAVTKSSESIPLPVMLIEKKGNIQDCKLISIAGSNTNGMSPTVESSSDMSKDTTIDSRTDKMNDELLKNVNAIPLLSYNDLLEATNYWSEKNLLGKGGFGQVYKGEWKLLPVAVKRLLGQDESNKELIRELCLNQYRHDNILPLYGYSIGGPETCLVYQLMLGDSLDKRLKSKTQPLTWQQRYRIAHGVARGLAYLHTMAGTPLIHGDIKPGNILLDTCTMPKIGDFGLARKGPYGGDRTHLKVSKVHGTGPYLPEEYLGSRFLSPAVDVFSYGVVLLEIATALPPADKARSPALLTYYMRDKERQSLDLVDVFSYGVVLLEIATALPPADKARSPALLTYYMRDKERQSLDLAIFEDKKIINTPLSSPPLCRKFIQMGLHCTHHSWTQRPTMMEAYKTLDVLDVPGKNDI